MELFAVFKVGVYRHECGGIFSTYEIAAELAHKLLAGEHDEYHSYEVCPFELDVQTPRVKATYVEGGFDLEEATPRLHIKRKRGATMDIEGG